MYDRVMLFWRAPPDRRRAPRTLALRRRARTPSATSLERPAPYHTESTAATTKGTSMRTPIRHGEILLVPVTAAPKGAIRQVTECIVGHSESGHHHVLESDALFAEIIAANGDLYVDLDALTPLRHRKTYQQHRELTVPAGAWRVIRKTEFDVRAVPDPPETAVPSRIPKPAAAAVRSVEPSTPPRPVRWVRD
jgi:hypothetical protein